MGLDLDRGPFPAVEAAKRRVIRTSIRRRPVPLYRSFSVSLTQLLLHLLAVAPGNSIVSLFQRPLATARSQVPHPCACNKFPLALSQ